MYNKTIASTQHGINTPYGANTPHRYPTKTSTASDLLSVVDQLYPTGRAWNMPENGLLSALHSALNISFLRLIEDSAAVINNNIPDNELFEENDCDLWEYRLGLISNPTLSLTERRSLIFNKMGYPNNIKARQSASHIQHQLNQSGFNVGVYENAFYDAFGNRFYKLPSDIIAGGLTSTQHGWTTQHGGGTQHGSGGYEVIANSLQEGESYNVGGLSKLWSTFFIAGPDSIYDTAIIPSIRKTEFREQVLKLKPAHTVAFVFITH
ncbi:MAG: hypothetical protein V4547_16385 [Bacteroidota bacterium]